MRRHATPGPPGLGHFGECLGVRALAQAEGDARGFLHGEIARRKRIGVAETEQQIDVGGPWPDSMQCRQRRMGLIGIHVADSGEIDMAFCDRLADLPDRFDLGAERPSRLSLSMRARRTVS